MQLCAAEIDKKNCFPWSIIYSTLTNNIFAFFFGHCHHQSQKERTKKFHITACKSWIIAAAQSFCFTEKWTKIISVISFGRSVHLWFYVQFIGFSQSINSSAHRFLLWYFHILTKKKWTEEEKNYEKSHRVMRAYWNKRSHHNIQSSWINTHWMLRYMCILLLVRLSCMMSRFGRNE